MTENEKQLKDLLDSLEIEYQDVSDTELRMKDCVYCGDSKNYF